MKTFVIILSIWRVKLKLNWNVARNTQIAVITRKVKTQSEAAKPSYIPESPAEIDDETTEADIRKQMLLDRASKLKLQIHDQLMKILKDIPHYDMRADAF